MSYTYLQEQGEESLAESFSDIPASALSRLNLTAERSYSNGSEMESCQSFQFGTMSGPSTESHGAEKSISLPADSPARTLAALDQGRGSVDREADYGASSLVSLAKFDPGTHSLRTLQTLLFEGCTESLLILPKWGWMRDGECFLLAPLVPHICDSECSFWPTPRAGGRDNCGGSNARKKAQANGTYIGRYPNPILQERLMAWPESWTDLEQLEMDKFQQWRLSHGGF